ncbi:MAG: DUF1207 domain-containing protein [Proteobacteria bacterium]|nr:DUF1207 domain-containing protein [Pseudomonadota bacterium]
MVYLRFMVVLGVFLMSVYSADATTPEDAYIAGYAASALKQNFNLDMSSLVVRDGIITLPAGSINAFDRAKALKILSEIPGVIAVDISEDTVQESMAESLGDETIATATQSFLLTVGLLPSGHLFLPLVADPRWAHFSAVYRNYQKNEVAGRNIASVQFGETIPFYRGYFGQSTAQWESGLHAGVFSDFNMDAPSAELLNADYIGSIYSSVRAGQFSAFGRIYHQSSHLGDEFLIRKMATKFERVNLSYEGVDLKLSYELSFGVRVYGGGGGLLRKEPTDLKVWSSQYGVEVRSPWRIESAAIRPIIGVDCKNYEENNWNMDISVKAGAEFEKLQVLGRKMQVLLEYFNGYTPVGQFYKDKVEYIGLGAHYLF